MARGSEPLKRARGSGLWITPVGRIGLNRTRTASATNEVPLRRQDEPAERFERKRCASAPNEYSDADRSSARSHL